jgi:hypothetical protein
LKEPAWERLLDDLEPERHLVHLYAPDGTSLVANVSRYLAEGVRRGEGVVVVATAEHADAFLRAMHDAGTDAAGAMREGRFIVLDARETLVAILVDGHPEWSRFHAVVDAKLEEARSRARGAGLRVYGEMVGVLWEAGQGGAAAQLESHWNRSLLQSGFALFCAYPIDVFGPQFEIAGIDAMLCAHTHVLPARDDAALQHAVNRAMTEVLGRRAEGLRLLIKPNFRPSWAALPRGEAEILWVRNNLPEYANEILGRARESYHASHA